MKRNRFQGVCTVLRFNWHFFAGAGVVLLALYAVAAFFPHPLNCVAFVLASLGALAVIISLTATYVAYDATGLYALGWLDPWMKIRPSERAANIHAGFDETGALLTTRYPGVRWSVFDFYDPAKHTEISIRRARAAHPPSPGTIAISTTEPLPADERFERILLLLAAHEIRDHAERVRFFVSLRHALAPGGAIIVTEHLRDLANFAAYNIGAWHFHTRSEWLATFAEAGLRVETRRRLNLFITAFVLRPA
jgi:hypothetical protein